MQLDEQIEKSFKAGIEWWEEFYNAFDDFPSDTEIEEAYTEYINGNSESSKGNVLLDKSYGGST